MINIGDHTKRLEEGRKHREKMESNWNKLFADYQKSFQVFQDLQAERRDLREKLAQFERGELELIDSDLRIIYSQITALGVKIDRAGNVAQEKRKVYDNQKSADIMKLVHMRAEAVFAWREDKRKLEEEYFEKRGWNLLA